MDNQSLTLTENAARKINALVAAENQPELKLRLAVHGGGCSGFQYSFALDASKNDDDTLIMRDGAGLLVDRTSLDLLAGAQVDYVEELLEASFRIINPNAKSGCGCGNSFSL